MAQSGKTTVVFIHGLWLHASSWKAWQELFEAAGYNTLAPGWPGDSYTVEETRKHPETLNNIGVHDAVDHYRDAIKAVEGPVVLVGHSYGGLIVQELLTQGVGVAGVAIDPAQPKGVLPLPLAQLISGFPVLGHPSNLRRTVMLTPEQFHYGFTNELSPEESQELYDKWVIPAPGRPLFQAAAANFNPHAETKVDFHNSDRGPLLLIGGGKDHTVPKVLTEANERLFENSDAKTEFKLFPDRGHSLTIDHGWREVADYTLRWLREVKY